MYPFPKDLHHLTFLFVLLFYLWTEIDILFTEKRFEDVEVPVQ